MKKILVTLSMICFVVFLSNAQTTPTVTPKATATSEVKTDAVKSDAVATAAAPVAKKSGCCHKGMSSADCKNKSKNCSKSSSESKAQKSSTTGGSNN